MYKINKLKQNKTTIYLNKANFLGIASEALPAAHQPILPDQSMRVTAYTAAKVIKISRNQYSIKNLNHLKTFQKTFSTENNSKEW